MNRRVLFSLLLVAAVLVAVRTARAAPEAHILRIDPRAGMTGGKPELTTVIEVVQFKRLSDVLQPCASASGAATLSCWSTQLEKPGALWDPFPFPEQNARMLVKVAGEDTLTKFVDKTQWGKAQNQANVGTAWLVSVDASSGMGGRYNDARAIAHDIIESMRTNDLMDLMFFDDVQVVQDTKWKTYKQRADLANALNGIKSPMPSHGNDRALFKIIKNMTQDAFGSLGNSDAPDQVPLHQAMVVLSNGAGRGDPESASPSADVFHQYLNAGRFPPENTSLPKTPLPVVSIWFPNPSSFTESIYRNNEAQFMQSLANPEIGGFFDVVKEGEGNAKAKTIFGLIRARFDAMWLVHWELSCINPSVEQTFNLVFENTKPVIAPDGTFKEVPLGIDPTQWPLDVDAKKTTDAATQNPVYPGGQLTVYGNFCWSGDKTRAEAYFIPAGTKPNAQTSSRDPSVARAAMQQLQAEHMLGTAAAAGDAYVTFNVPDDDKVLEGAGDNMAVRLVVYDNKAHRASALDEKSVLTLKAAKKPLSWPLVAGLAGLAIVIVLLLLVLLRGGGRKRGGTPPSAAGPPAGYGAGPGGYGGAAPPAGYGPPPGGYGPPAGGYGPPPGGYGMQQVGAFVSTGAQANGGSGAIARPPDAGFAGTVQAPQSPFVAQGPPAQGGGQPAPADPSVSAAPPAIRVQCPACGMSTMATPGQLSMCFSCGQPLPAEIARGGEGVAAPGFPGPSPVYAGGGTRAQGVYAAHGANAATLRGTAGQYTVRAGSEVRVGRDPARCAIFLSEPRVSGVHASLRLDGGQLLVKDETSNNGTWASGARIEPGAWTAVPVGAPVRFGPIEFQVELEG